jgi:hypothetical protein
VLTQKFHIGKLTRVGNAGQPTHQKSLCLGGLLYPLAKHLGKYYTPGQDFILTTYLVLDKLCAIDAYFAQSCTTTLGAAIVIIETSVFTRRVQDLLTDEEYRELQTTLINRPTAGTLIQGSDGLRKVRWALPGRGKSGGARVIYYWAVEQGQLLMLFMFAKNERDDLSPAQRKMLRQIVEDEYP